jgi:hypothetical protein
LGEKLIYPLLILHLSGKEYLMKVA